MNSELSSKLISKSLTGQFSRSWKMLEAAIASVTDEKWHSGVGKWFFSLTAYHVIETAQFYMGSDPDAMKWGGKAGFDWKEGIDVKKKILPKLTKDLVKSYLTETREKLNSLLSSMTNQDLQQVDGFHWFDSIFEKMVYLLRHNMHHIGELSRTLRDWDCEPVKWC